VDAHCPSCQVTFNVEVLPPPGPQGHLCPTCQTPLRKGPTPVSPGHSRPLTRPDPLDLAPSAPPGSALAFPDSETVTDPGRAVAAARSRATADRRSTVPGLAGRDMPRGSAPPGVVLPDPHTEPTVTTPGARPPAGPGQDATPAGSDPGAPASGGVVPPTALGGERSKDLGYEAVGRTVSDVFSPVGAFDPSANVIVTPGDAATGGPVAEPAAPRGAGAPPPPAGPAASQGEAGIQPDAGASTSARELDLGGPGTSPHLELDLSKIKRPRGTTGPIARPGTAPDLPARTSPAIGVTGAHARPVVKSGLPGWVLLVIGAVVIGIGVILAIELRDSEEAADAVAVPPLVDPLDDLAAETARAERLLSGWEAEQKAAQRSQIRRKHTARSTKKKKARKDRRPAKAAASKAAHAAAMEHYKQGNSQLRKRNIDAAIKAYRRALRADPGFGFAHRGLGVAFALRRKSKQAVQHYKMYLRTTPDAPDAVQVRKIISQFEGR